MPTTPYPPSAKAVLVLDAQAIERALRRISHEIIERNPALDKVVIVGIPSRGVEIARRIVDYIEQIEKIRPEFGVIDVMEVGTGTPQLPWMTPPLFAVVST